MVTDEERDLMLRAYATDAEMRINLGIRRRLAPLLGNDRRKFELLNALLFSLPGTPVLYYGDEIGMGDNVYLGDRNGVRTPMQWSADRNAGFSTANPHRLYLPLITEQGYHYESINVETQAANPASPLSWMRQLTALRKRHRVLGRGTIDFLEPDNHHVLAFVRCPTAETPGEQPLLCVANLSRLAQHVELDLRRFGGAVPVEVFGQNRFAPIGDAPYTLTLAPYGFFWFALETERSDRGRHRGPGAPGGCVARRAAPASRPRPGDQALASRAGAGSSARARSCATSSVEDVVELSGSVAFAVVRTSFTEGDDHLYSVPLLHTTPGAAEELEHRRPGSVIALLDDGAIVDAMTVPEGAGVVAGSALRRRTRRGRASTATGHPRRPGLTKLADNRPRRARAQRRADEHVGDPRRQGDRQADPPPRSGRQPRRHPADAPARRAGSSTCPASPARSTCSSAATRRPAPSSSMTSSPTRPTCGSGARTCWPVRSSGWCPSRGRPPTTQ